MRPGGRRLHMAEWAVALAVGLAVLVSADDGSPAPGAQSLQTELTRLVALMDGAAQALARGETGDKVQTAQRDILATIERLLAQLKARQQGAGTPGSGGQQGAPPEGRRRGPGAAEAKGPPAGESVMPAGRWGGAVEGTEPGESPAWLATLPAAQREPVRQAFRTGRLPGRYERLIEHYGRRLAREE